MDFDILIFLLKAETKEQLIAILELDMSFLRFRGEKLEQCTEPIMEQNICISESFLFYFYRKPP